MRLEGDAWRTFFDAYRWEAFRLETRQSYGVASEQVEYEHFVATGAYVEWKRLALDRAVPFNAYRMNQNA